MGKWIRNFQDVDYVLRVFGDGVAKERRDHREYVQKSMELRRRPELVGGGLLRSSWGLGCIKSNEQSAYPIHFKGDERILGESNFVKKALAEQKEQFERWFAEKKYLMT